MVSHWPTGTHILVSTVGKCRLFPLCFILSLLPSWVAPDTLLSSGGRQVYIFLFSNTPKMLGVTYQVHSLRVPALVVTSKWASGFCGSAKPHPWKWDVCLSFSKVLPVLKSGSLRALPLREEKKASVLSTYMNPLAKCSPHLCPFSLQFLLKTAARVILWKTQVRLGYSFAKNSPMVSHLI